jgi:hypothetical protein
MGKFGDSGALSGARIECCYDRREYSYCKSSLSTVVDIASSINEVTVAILNKASNVHIMQKFSAFMQTLL